MWLITGASGTVGSAVLAAASASGQPYRALYRSAEEAAKAPPGTATVLGDFADSASLAAALDGIESVFLVCSPIRELVQLETNVIDACIAAGGRRIVLSSALGAGDYPKSFPSWHRQVEDRLKATALPHCILRPNTFMQNVTAFFAPGIRAEGAFYAAMGTAEICFIDIRDVAVVAAQALSGAHDGKTYELHGPESLSYGAVADRITRIAKVPARFVDIPRAAQEQAMTGLGMPAWQVTALLDLQEYYTGGRGGVPDATLEHLLGRKPRRVDAYVAEHEAAFRSEPRAA